MKTNAMRLLTFLTLLGISVAPAFPQADVMTATLKGTVTDPSNAVVAGASVTTKSLEKGTTRATKTDAAGFYQIALLQPGPYELRVESPGFKTQVVPRVELTVGQIGVFDLRLDLGAVTQQVLISAELPLIETERTQQANTIGDMQVTNLPNVGRGFTAYVFTLPGVSSSDAPRVQNPGFTFGSSGFSIGGSNGRNNLITLDGGENEYGSGQLRTNISVEAVQEFQVNRNAFAAEYGFTAGTAINVISKSGANDFHGSGFVFFRSQKTSARNFFDFLPREAFNQQVYPGATAGGPLVKNKAFFFTSYEMLKSDQARFRRYTDNPAVLGPNAAQAAFLAQLDTSSNANVRRISGNLRGALTTTNFPNTMKLLRQNEGAFNSPDRLHSWTTRVDYQVGDNDSLSTRFSLTH